MSSKERRGKRKIFRANGIIQKREKRCLSIPSLSFTPLQPHEGRKWPKRPMPPRDVGVVGSVINQRQLGVGYDMVVVFERFDFTDDLLTYGPKGRRIVD